MSRLAIEDTPVYRGSRKGTIGVRCFGAIGNGPAIGAALNSGAAEICFEPGRCLLNSPVVIPSNVEHINLGSALENCFQQGIDC